MCAVRPAGPEAAPSAGGRRGRAGRGTGRFSLEGKTTGVTGLQPRVSSVVLSFCILGLRARPRQAAGRALGLWAKNRVSVLAGGPGKAAPSRRAALLCVVVGVLLLA